MSKRAIRRAHRERLKKQRRYRWGRELSTKELGMALTTPTPCSCWMCGNQGRIVGDKAKYRALEQTTLFSIMDC